MINKKKIEAEKKSVSAPKNDAIIFKGLTSDQMDEMNDLEMGLDAYKKLKGIKK